MADLSTDVNSSTATAKPMSDKAVIGRLWRDYIWPQKKRLLTAIFFMIVLALATAAYGFVVKYIIDTATALENNVGAFEKTRAYAYAVIPVLIGITFLSGASNYIQRVLTNSVALNAIATLQKHMFARVHGADYDLFVRSPSGHLISRFTHDVTALSNALIRTLSNLIKDAATLVFLGIGMLILDWQLTLFILILYPIAAWPVIKISKRLRGDAKATQAHTGTLTSELKDSFTSARLVKTYGLEDIEQKRLGKSFDERIRLFLKLVSQQARVDPILEVFGGLAIAGVIIFGVYQVSSGHASPGDIAGVLTQLLVASPRIRALGTLNNVIQEGLAASERIFEMIDMRPVITDPPTPQTPTEIKGHIRFDDVSFIYPGGEQGARNLTLEALPGQMIALVGPSGAGKTTIMNLLSRLYDIDGGRITLDNIEITALRLKDLRDAFALVSQDVSLFQDTVAANIGLGRVGASRDDIIKAAKAADAHGFISALPHSYDTVLEEGGETLSGGQKQRLSIARALLRDAPVLLLDEATSALDGESEGRIQTALSRLQKGRTTIVIAHRLETIRAADNIYVLDKGEIVESGTHASLIKKKNGLYKRLAKSLLE